ncbi:hypothetical protein C7S18_22900 [Ahniella affigens]|uniref:Carboxyltransferase domain-containing protein n=1 Tax=Ahniella affigens TaxID=2021234 RepID=A0A2P1PYD0_9GAMM|nr:hypothetical protein [Ahniella affigens]AVP99848.1 hypothetical protein C7S18_22900 [Ahniella affigens]
MSITVHDAGVLATIQGDPRRGFEQFGVPPSGAMDRVACLALNALLGNAPDGPVIELALGTLNMTATETRHVAVLAQGFELRIDGAMRALAEAHVWPAGSRLTLRRREGPGYAYLGIGGRWRLSPQLGSVSTDVRNHIGGMAGRPLQAGDCFEIESNASADTPPARLRLRWPLQDLQHPQLRVIVHEPKLAAPLFGANLTVDLNSTRQALLLHPPTSVPHDQRQRLSTPQWPGAIQALPDGRFALLGPEAQTIGGYPLVASVCAADLSRLGRISGGQTLRCLPVSVSAAAQLARQQQAWLREWLSEITLRRAPNNRG